MLPTPSTSHVHFDNIYEPAEDSFLLLDTLSSPDETRFLRARFPPGTPAPLVLEIGTGSGVVLAFVTAHAHHVFGRRDVVSLGTDVNALACAATAVTARRACADSGVPGGAGVFADSVSADLAGALRPGLVDVLLFNPPYVPTETAPRPAAASDENGGRPLTATETFERDSRLLSLSYAGGRDGMEITSRLLDDLPRLLSPRGVAYVLLCAQNRPAGVIEMVADWRGGWRAEQVSQSGKTAGWEKLCVVRIWRGS